MKLRNLPLWAEVVAGLVVWTMAASAIVLWILPVPGVSPWAAGVATGPAADGDSKSEKTQAFAGNSNPHGSVAPLAQAPKQGWTFDAASLMGAGASIGSPTAPLEGGAPVVSDDVWLTSIALITDPYDYQFTAKYVAVDATTGRALWQKTGHPKINEDGLDTCASQAMAGSFVCLSVHNGGEDGSHARIVSVDPRTGTETVVMDDADFGVLAVTEGAILLAWLDPSPDVNELKMRRIDARGHTVWSQARVLADAELDGSDSQTRQLDVAGGHVAFTYGSRTWFLNLDDGSTIDVPFGLGELAADGAVIATTVSGGGIAPKAAMVTSASRGAKDEIVMEQGSRYLGGDTWVARKNDGGDVAYDTKTGRRKWASPGSDDRGFAFATDAIVTHGDGGVCAIEEGSGKARWCRPDLVPEYPTGVVDGERALILSGDEILALSLRDGKSQWRLSVGKTKPGLLYSVAGRLVVIGGGQIRTWW